MTPEEINMIESLKFFEEMQHTNNCCEQCKYYCHEEIDDGYVCVNANSYNCTNWVEPSDCCSEFECK